jgi:hypothetical protein
MNNKYAKLYDKIVTRAKVRVNNTYTERHHILPTSLGGNDDPSNLVDLTAREHYLCHWLLTKMTTGRDQRLMEAALWAMSNQKGENREERSYRIPSSVYERRRIESSIRMREINTGRKYPNRKKPEYSDEERERRRQQMKELGKSCAGRVLSEETKAKIRAKRALQVSPPRGPRSEETKAKIRAKRALQTNVKNQYSSKKSESDA